MFKRKEYNLSKNKKAIIDFATGKDTFTHERLNLSIKWTKYTDQAGIYSKINLFNLFCLSMSVFDVRFWNEKTNDWHTPFSWQRELNKNN